MCSSCFGRASFAALTTQSIIPLIGRGAQRRSRQGSRAAFSASLHSQSVGFSIRPFRIARSAFLLVPVSRLLYNVDVAKKLIALRVKEGHYSQLERIAKIEDESVSEVIRKAIEDFLKRRAKK